MRNLMSDDDWSFVEPFLHTQGPKSGRPPSNHRLILDGIFWIARTGAPWRDLPNDFGKWSSVYRQFPRWTLLGVWDVLLDTLNDARAVPDTVQMIDSTIIRAHHQTAGAKGELRKKVLAVQKVVLRPKYTFEQTPKDCP